MARRTAVRRGLVIGCGGTLGAAWTVGALVAVEQALRWDPRTAAALVGTSAGAEFVALLGGGVGVPELLAAQLGQRTAHPDLIRHFGSAPPMLPPVPAPRLGSPGLARRGLRREVSALTALSGLLPIGRGNPQRLHELAEFAAPDGGWVPHPVSWVVAADYDTGQRVAFGGPDAPTVTLSEAVRASWAVPGWYPPVRVGGRRYIDGGAVSPTSADLLLPLELDEVVVLAPMASLDAGPTRGVGARIERVMRRAMTRRLEVELALLRTAGVRVIRLDPGPADLAATGANFMNRSRRLRTLETSLRTSRAALARSLSTSDSAPPAVRRSQGVR